MALYTITDSIQAASLPEECPLLYGKDRNNFRFFRRLVSKIICTFVGIFH